MRDVFLFYPYEDVKLKDFSVSITQNNEDYNIRLGIFINAEKKDINFDIVRDIFLSLDGIKNEKIYYCFAVSYGRYSRYVMCFFEHIFSFFNINTVYQGVLNDKKINAIRDDIKNERIHIIFQSFFAKNRAKKFIKRYC